MSVCELFLCASTFVLIYYVLVSGICTGVPSGSHLIGYWIGMCANYVNHADGYTGWGSSFHVFAEELLLEEAKTCSTAVPVNCG